jgi:hypothetical protein
MLLHGEGAFPEYNQNMMESGMRQRLTDLLQ